MMLWKLYFKINTFFYLNNLFFKGNNFILINNLPVDKPRMLLAKSKKKVLKCNIHSYSIPAKTMIHVNSIFLPSNIFVSRNVKNASHSKGLQLI